MAFVTKERIGNDFRHHAPPTPEAGAPLTTIRNLLHDAAIDIVNLTPAGREQALALTKLEEAMFWSNAAIARQWPS